MCRIRIVCAGCIFQFMSWDLLCKLLLLKSGTKLVPVCGLSPCFTPFTAHRSKSSNVLLPSSSGGGGRPQAEILLMDVKKLWRLIDPSLPPLKTVPQMDRQLIGRHANLPIITLMINYLLTMIESFQPIPCENTSRSKSASKTTKPLQRRLKDLSKHL